MNRNADAAPLLSQGSNILGSPDGKILKLEIFKSQIRNIRSKLTEVCRLRSGLDKPTLELIGLGHERTWAHRDPSAAISDFGFEI
jgi:hypothetical protein